MFCLDCETTGVDFQHGSRPFFVGVCDREGELGYYEWHVDPLTRMPDVPAADAQEIRDRLTRVRGWGKFAPEVRDGHKVVGQNIKFDVAALRTIGIEDWPWAMTEDTLIAAHLLASNRPKNLTSLALQYLGENIEPCEERLDKAVLKVRNVIHQARLRVKRYGKKVPDPDRKLPKAGTRREAAEREAEEGLRRAAVLSRWSIAEEGHPMIPSCDKPYKADLWLPRAYAKWMWETSEAGRAYAAAMDRSREPNMFRRLLNADEAEKLPGWEWRPPKVRRDDDDPPHPYWTLLHDYANTDTSVTVMLWPVMRKELERRGLMKLYRAQMRLPEIAARMERGGVTGSVSRHGELREEFRAALEKTQRVCVNVARSLDYDLVLPKNGVNNSLRQFCFGRADDVEDGAGGGTGKRGIGRDVPEERETPASVGGERPRRLPDGRGGTGGVTTVTGRRLRPNLEGSGGLQERTGVGSCEGAAITAAAVRPGCLNLTPVRNPKARTEAPSLDAKNAIPYYLATLPANGKALTFVRNLADSRKYATALSYLESYAKFMLPRPDGTFTLYPSANITGTQTLRWSMQNPNAQQISKQEKINLRKLFGPAPGREWWSLDAKNIELRIPAYESGEQDLIDLLEKMDEPPYYGSEHLLNFSTVYPDVWAKELAEVGVDKVGPHCKKKYAATYYQWCKNGDFAVGYGGGKETADRTFRKPGAYDALKSRFSKKAALNRKWIAYAEKYGYVETLPDRTVDPERGYPLLCTRTEYGKILTTVPLNYHVQGTACWVNDRGMVKCQDCLDSWRAEDGFDAWLVFPVHDELVFDLPAAPGMGNLPRVRELKRLMESVGQDLIPAMPLPVGMEYHEHNWGEGITI